MSKIGPYETKFQLRIGFQINESHQRLWFIGEAPSRGGVRPQEAPTTWPNYRYRASSILITPSRLLRISETITPPITPPVANFRQDYTPRLHSAYNLLPYPLVEPPTPRLFPLHKVLGHNVTSFNLFPGFPTTLHLYSGHSCHFLLFAWVCGCLVSIRQPVNIY